MFLVERGVIRNRKFAGQLRDFSGLRFGSITPTDMDGWIDFSNRLFVFIEAKHGNARMPYGQELALARLTDACHSPPRRRAIALVCRHESEGDIDFAGLPVTRYRWCGKWHDDHRGIGLRAVIATLKLKFG